MTVVTLSLIDERAEALDYLARKVDDPRRQYVLGRYLFTRAPVFGIPQVDIELPPDVDVTDWDAMLKASVVPRYRHRFTAIYLGDDWWGYFHDEVLGRRYQERREERAWWRGWIDYLRGGPRP